MALGRLRPGRVSYNDGVAGEGDDAIVADYIAEELARDGVRHVFGVGGANIEDLLAAVQRRRADVVKLFFAEGTAAARTRVSAMSLFWAYFFRAFFL